MRRPLTRLPLVSGALALLLAIGAAVVPPAAIPAAPFLAAFDAPVAFAADDLALTTNARYTLVPDKGVVRVAVAISATNEKPNKVTGGGLTRYYYDVVNLGVQPEGTRFRATQDGSALRVTTSRREGYRLVTINLRQNLFFQQTADVRLTYDLPGGKPRSASDVRVGPAFASFLAWAFGDRGTVRVDVPAAFKVDISGAEMSAATSPTGSQVFRATTTNPIEWFAWVNARNDEGLTRAGVELVGGDEIIVRAWPEDERWQRRVTSVLEEGVPELTSRIGLPWPVDGPLRVLEIHTPLLEGYAGFYNPQTDEITISEDLDDLTIIHEASHAWFNAGLFSERWITEGLAETYASEVVDAMGGDAPGPGDVDRDSPVAFPLNAWPPPSAIESQDASDSEKYGYDASFRVIRLIVERAGEDGMRRVFAAADAGTTAYPGDGPPERTTRPNDWRRFLDLTEEVGGAEGVAELLSTWALAPEEAATLDARTGARQAYATLRGRGDTWAPPAMVRTAMDGWAFEDAAADMRDASAVLDRRDAIASLASAEDLDPPDGLEAAYESAASSADLDGVAALAGQTESSLGLVVAAGNAAEAPRDWLMELGLSGRTPDADLAGARAAWEAGDTATASELATLVIGTLAVAPDAGRGRALVIGGGVGLLVLLLVALLLVARRRRARRAVRAVAQPPAAELAAALLPAAQAGPEGRPVPVVPPAAAPPVAAAPADVERREAPGSPAVPDGPSDAANGPGGDEAGRAGIDADGANAGP